MNTSGECCSGNSRIDQDTFRTLCPLCKDDGISVRNVTVENLVRDEFHHMIANQHFKICMNPACDVVYYGVDDESAFTKDQIRVPIWFKDGANPKYACYCSEITEEQVIEAVVKLGAASIKDVIAATGAMKNPNCIKKNPLGVCCHKIIKEAITKGENMR